MNATAGVKSQTSLVEQLNVMEKNRSVFEEELRRLTVPVINVFLDKGKICPAHFEESGRNLGEQGHRAELEQAFPNVFSRTRAGVLKASPSSRPVVRSKRVAVLFSGGPAAGGHNVLVGLFRALGPDNTLLGVKNGPKGLLEGRLFEITAASVAGVLNTGGFDFLGSDRTKIKTDEQFQQVKKTCQDHRLDALVIVGGDDSNTNAAVLSEFLFSGIHPDGRGVQVIGVPKTIDGDLQVGDLLPISFGFDTATKIYSELVGNILQDTPSSRKYWHFVKLMGRSASHVALEVALQTRPAVALISEEVEEKKFSLEQIVDRIARAVVLRAARGISHGVVLVPEGLIEFIPAMKVLIRELNEVLALHAEVLDGFHTLDEKKNYIFGKISGDSAKLMASLPDEFEDMLLLDRDAHGNLQVSQIPTEKLLVEMVTNRLQEMKAEPKIFFGPGDAQLSLNADEIEKFKKFKFAHNIHFFGYEGRCGAPSRFDGAFTLNLGLAAGSLVLDQKTGYMVTVTGFDRGGDVYAIPLAGLLQLERRHGKDEWVIEKALVKIQSPAFSYFSGNRDRWSESDCFNSPGPRQLWGPVAHQLPVSIALNQGSRELKFDLGEETLLF